jgi:hypothetical protein
MPIQGPRSIRGPGRLRFRSMCRPRPGLRRNSRSE